VSSTPIPDSYWVVPNRLLAGEYPGATTEKRAREKIARLIAAGIRTFVDLTEDSEPLAPYVTMMSELAKQAGVECRYVRYAIKDHDVPESSRLRQILDEIRSETAAGRPVYVHCWGGIGRTGTVIGCWLIEEGLESDAAILRIAELRKSTPSALIQSPETEVQRWFVFNWGERRRREETQAVRRSDDAE
jgi:protein tyrosine phosphatase (PTP) superfamily phosphohydrolase (DUF442 family)